VAVAPVSTVALTGWAVMDGDVTPGVGDVGGGGEAGAFFSPSNGPPALQPANMAWTTAHAAAF